MKITALIIVLVFICFDVLTGWLKALYTGTLDSSIMRKGLFHKVGETLAVAFGYICEICFPLVGVPMKVPIAAGICVYIVLMETASIVENLAHINPALSSVLTRFFDSSKLEPVEAGGKHLENESADSSRGADGEMGER